MDVNTTTQTNEKVENETASSSNKPLVSEGDPSDTPIDCIEKLSPTTKEEHQNPALKLIGLERNTRLRSSRGLQTPPAQTKASFTDNRTSHRRSISSESSKRDISKTMSIPNESPQIVTKKDSMFPVTAEAELYSNDSGDSESSYENSGDLTQSNEASLYESDVSNVEGATHDTSRKNHNRRKSTRTSMEEQVKDMFCWRCHRIGINISCTLCPRSFHQKCLRGNTSDANFFCPECVNLLEADSANTRCQNLKDLPIEHLCELLTYAHKRMVENPGAGPFIQPVSSEEFPEYKKYIVQPMDLTTLKENIKNLKYGSPQAYEADAKWILHNSIIFNSAQSKLSSAAKSILKLCKHEMNEIENCPNCYLNANKKKASWFVRVCPKPHLLVWAKLKGFPYWPAKVMSHNDQGMVDVRFFGAHDRAWIPYRECFLYCEKDPNTFKQKRLDIEECLQEMNVHIENLKRIFGEFQYAPFKTVFDPKREIEQLKILLPNFGNVQYNPLIEGDIEMLTYSEENDSDEEMDSDEMDDRENNGNIDLTKKNTSFSSNNLIDTTMEGYGTDDNSIKGETSVDKQSSNIHKSVTTVNKELKIKDEQIGNATFMEDDEDEDTQVSNNISMVELSASVSKARKSLVMETVSERQKSSKRRQSDTGVDSNRSPENCSKSKTSRRNSDISIKSDSSRISGKSDKINKVDNIENMEISLGGGVSDNISMHNGGESSRSDSESSCNIEVKRKPVQVDINNAEISISPTNKTTNVVEKQTNTSECPKKMIEEVKRKLVNEHKSKDDLKMMEEKNCSKSNIDTLPSDEKKPLESNIIENNGIISDEISPQDENSNQHNNSTELNDQDKSSNDHTEIIEAIVEKSSEPTIPVLKDVKNPNVISSTHNISETTPTLESDSSEEISAEELLKKDATASIDSVEINKYNIFNIIHSSLNGDNRNISSMSISNETVLATNDEMKKSAGKHGSNTQISLEEDPLKLPDAIEISSESNSIITSASNNLPSENDRREEKDVDEIADVKAKVKPKKVGIREGLLGEIRVKNLPKERDRSQNEISDKFDSENNSITTMKRKHSFDSAQEPPKKIIRKEANISQKNLVENLNEVEIKCEPESDDDDFNEDEDLDEKRRYLSALNISEKVDNPSKEQKGNEIRTRSKAEEKRERFRIVDNLSRIIDEVATNYNNPQHKRDMPLKPKQSIPSFSKPRSAHSDHQRARKSFPVPVYQKIQTTVDKQADSVAKHNSNKETVKTSVSNTFLRVIPSPHHSKVTKAYSNASVSTNSTPTSIHGETTLPQSHLILIHPNNPLQYGTSVVSAAYGTPTTAIYTKASSQTITAIPQQALSGSTKTSFVMKQVLQPVAKPQQFYIQKTPIKQQQQQQVAASSLLRNKLTASPNLQGSPMLDPVVTSSSTTQGYTNISNDLLPVVNSNNEVLSPVASTTTPPTNQDGDIMIVDADPPEEEVVEDQESDEFSEIHRLLPAEMSHALANVFLRPPLKPKPRPPGILSRHFDGGAPSSAGDVTTKINSIAHRMTDYFRGMLTETLEELGESLPESNITALELEIERLKHVHKIEIAELKRNFTNILSELQKSLAKERENLEDRIRAECEAETIKRVDLAKSKQWCAYCSRESQLYCCWNTSYCDYPCQKKHWTQHMNQCTQNLDKTSSGSTPTSRVILKPTTCPPKQTMGRPPVANKVYPRASGPPKSKSSFKTSTGNQITVIETAPGSFELYGKSGENGKKNNVNTKFKTNIISVSSPYAVELQALPTTSSEVEPSNAEANSDVDKSLN